MTLVLDIHTHITQGEIAGGMLGHGNRLNRIALTLTACRLQGIIKFHIRIQRVVLRTDNLLGI